MFNLLKTAVLMAAITALFMAVGAFIGGRSGMMFALVVAVGLNFFSYWFSDKLVLKMYNAREVDESSAPQFHSMIAELAQKAGLPMPRVYVIDEAAPNAFATGRNPKHAALAVTTGLLETMNRVELEGVIAHELSHIRNRDVRLMSLVAVLVGVVALLSDFLFRISIFGGGRKSGGTAGLIAFALGLAALALAPIAAVLIQLAVSRRREYLADASGAEITGDGEGLALALRKLELDTTETRHASRAVAHLYIENPLNQASGMRGAMRSLFDTHPPLTARIAALEEAGGFQLPPI